jgi:hypothetical protein
MMATSGRIYRFRPDSLCDDVPFGVVMRRSLLSDGMPLDVEHYLSVTVEFWHRLSKFHDATLIHAEHKFRVSGPVLELNLQVLVRPLAPWGEVAKYEAGLRQLGDPDGPWPLDRFRTTPGVTLGAVMRLRELSNEYNHNLKDPRAIDAPTRAVLIPREVEQEIRTIAAQLRAGNGGSTSGDTR